MLFFTFKMSFFSVLYDFLRPSYVSLKLGMYSLVSYLCLRTLFWQLRDLCVLDLYIPRLAVARRSNVIGQ